MVSEEWLHAKKIKMFQDKVIIITGSSQGIGLKTAEMLVEKGAKVVINSRSPQKVEKAVAKLKAKSLEVMGLAGDVSDFHFCEELKKQTLHRFGQIDMLINNAGVASGGRFSELSAVAFQTVVQINLLGSIYPTLACLDEIKKQKGSILFISSVAGILGLPNYSSYSATKRALVSVAESLKIELMEDGVFVGVNYPGFTENDADKKMVNAQGEEEILRKREGVKVSSLEQTVKTIIRQLEQKKFRMYSTTSARLIQGMYRFFPELTFWIMAKLKNRFDRMQ